MQINIITGNGADNLLRSYGYEDDWQSQERFFGLSGNDTLHGFAGDDYLDGGPGIDLAIYGGLKNDYVISRTQNGFQIKDTRQGVETDGKDTLVDIELLRFANGDFQVADLLPNPMLSGQVYHWKSKALLSGVEVGDGTVVTVADGRFSLTDLSPGMQLVNPHLDLTSRETGAVISSADALAALKIAVGRNPNADNTAVSPYQFIAADVNEDGKVTSADALAILKMAVKRSDAPAREWIFVDERHDFWNEATSTFTTTRTSVPRPADLAITVDPASRSEVNLVGMLKGDVNGSWLPDSLAATLPSSYFDALLTNNPNTIGAEQFG